MKKITLEKHEEIAEVIERILSEDDDELAVVIPKGSPLGRSIANFHLLKREAEGAGKSVAIESVDDTILAFAKESGLDASHPLWRGVRSGGVSDIIPAAEDIMPEIPGNNEKRGVKKHAEMPVKHLKSKKLIVHEADEDDESDDVRGGEHAGGEGEEQEFEKEEKRFFARRSAPERSNSGDFEDDDEEDEDGSPRRRSHKWVWVVGCVVVVAVILWGVTGIFGHAAITLDFQKTPWNSTGSFVASKSASTTDIADGLITAQVFTANKDTTQLFQASGNANVSLKAQGTITIYNDYSTASQDLVKKTRFLTPDGKLFRLTSDVTVPGAQMKDGQLVPSLVTATVAADQAGEDYNVGAVSKLTIPGFQGGPKYNGFYGALLNGASGGFIGMRPVPTDADISSAKTKTTSILQSALSDNITAAYPNNFKILDGATDITIDKLTVNTTTDQNGNFSVFGEASLQAIGFDEAAFKASLASLAGVQASVNNPAWNALDLSYSNVHADWSKGQVSFTLNATGTLEQAFSVDGFKDSIEGKSIKEAQSSIVAIPGLTSGKISVWPFWLWSVPTNPNKIQVDMK